MWLRKCKPRPGAGDEDWCPGSQRVPGEGQLLREKFQDGISDPGGVPELRQGKWYGPSSVGTGVLGARRQCMLTQVCQLESGFTGN